MSNTVVPVSDRNAVMDTLRAFALFGVIVMNIISMVMALVGDEVFANAVPADYALGLADLVLLMGKARSAFAFLFGVGFGILMQRANEKGPGFVGFYFRRMSVLLLIGVVNMLFLFWGDILIMYALIGMVLILFRDLSQRALLTVGLILVIVPPLLAGGYELLTGMPGPNLAGFTPDQVAQWEAARVPAYRSADFIGYIHANWDYYIAHYAVDTSYAAVYSTGVLGLFLLGVWTARKGLLSDIEAHRKLLRRIFWICLPVGLIISVVHALRRLGMEPEGLGPFVTAAYIGLPIMAFGYMAVLALWLSRWGAFMTKLLSPTGRMALTGYLASNVIGGFIWYGWGLGQMGKMGVTDMNLVALGIFVGLAVFSALWLSVFRLGPAEWLWRSLSYGKLQPLRRKG